MEVLLRAQSLFRGGSLEQAVALLESHMASHPKDMRVAAALGRIYRSIQQPEKAARWLRYSLQDHYAPPDFDEEDIAYLAESAGEEPGLELDFDYGVAVGQTEAANDDISHQQEQDSPQALLADELLEATFSEPKESLEGVGTGKKEETGEIGREPVDSFDEVENLDVTSVLTDTPQYLDGELTEELFSVDEEVEAPFPSEDSEEFGQGLDELFEEISDDAEDELESFYIELDPEDPGQDDEPEELPERLTHREKAEGIAAGLAVEGEWLKKDMGILVDILAHHRSHGKTQSALRELLIKKQVTPSELHVLYELRKIWGSGGYNRTYRKQQAEDGWPNVSWRLALDLTRAVKSDDAVEVMLFVEDCFQDWNASTEKITAFPIFSYYLQHILDHMEEMALCCGQAPPAYIEYDFFEKDDDGWEQWHRPEPFNFNIYRESEDSQW